MHVNPKLLQLMLQLQVMNTITTLPTAASSRKSVDGGFGAGVDFAALLEQMSLQQSNPASGQSFKPSTVQPAGSRSTYHPAMRLAQPSSASQTEYESLIEQTSARFGVDSSLVKAVVKAESGYNPNAVSHVGAKGLMQLMDGTARMLGVSNSFDPQQNVEGGTRYLRDLLRQYEGNVGTALAAYNAGPGTLAKLGIANDKQLAQKYSSLPKETQAYVRNIMNDSGLKS